MTSWKDQKSFRPDAGAWNHTSAAPARTYRRPSRRGNTDAPCPGNVNREISRVLPGTSWALRCLVLDVLRKLAHLVYPGADRSSEAVDFVRGGAARRQPIFDLLISNSADVAQQPFDIAHAYSFLKVAGMLAGVPELDESALDAF